MLLDALLGPRAAPRARSFENPAVPLSDASGTWFEDWATGGPTSSGQRLGPERADTLSAVWRAVNLNSSALAGLPLRVLETTGEGADERRLPRRDHPAWRLLAREPNEDMSPRTFRECLSRSLELRGAGYAWIVRDASARPLRLWPLVPWLTTPIRTTAGLFYEATVADPADSADAARTRVVRIPASDVLAVTLHTAPDGVTPISPVAKMAEALGIAKAAEGFAGGFFGRGGKPSGLLKYPSARPNEELEQSLKRTWMSAVGGAKQQGVMPVPSGVEWIQIGMAPGDAQLLESRRFSIEEVARIFDVPPHLLFLLEQAHFRNAEELSRVWVEGGLMARAQAWEQEIERKLFTESEKRSGNLEAQIDLKGLLRGSLQARTAYYVRAIQWGWMTPNEARRLEDLDPMEGADELYFPGNMQPLDQAGDPTEGDAGAANPGAVGGSNPNDGEGGDPGGSEARAALFEPILRDAAEAVLRKERKRLAALAARDDGAALDVFYGEDYPQAIVQRFGPAFEAIARLAPEGPPWSERLAGFSEKLAFAHRARAELAGARALSDSLDASVDAIIALARAAALGTPLGAEKEMPCPN